MGNCCDSSASRRHHQYDDDANPTQQSFCQHDRSSITDEARHPQLTPSSTPSAAVERSSDYYTISNNDEDPVVHRQQQQQEDKQSTSRKTHHGQNTDAGSTSRSTSSKSHGDDDDRDDDEVIQHQNQKSTSINIKKKGRTANSLNSGKSHKQEDDHDDENHDDYDHDLIHFDSGIEDDDPGVEYYRRSLPSRAHTATKIFKNAIATGDWEENDIVSSNQVMIDVSDNTTENLFSGTAAANSEHQILVNTSTKSNNNQGISNNNSNNFLFAIDVKSFSKNQQEEISRNTNKRRFEQQRQENLNIKNIKKKKLNDTAPGFPPHMTLSFSGPHQYNSNNPTEDPASSSSSCRRLRPNFRDYSAAPGVSPHQLRSAVSGKGRDPNQVMLLSTTRTSNSNNSVVGVDRNDTTTSMNDMNGVAPLPQATAAIVVSSSGNAAAVPYSQLHSQHHQHHGGPSPHVSRTASFFSGPDIAAVVSAHHDDPQKQKPNDANNNNQESGLVDEGPNNNSIQRSKKSGVRGSIYLSCVQSRSRDEKAIRQRSNPSSILGRNTIDDHDDNIEAIIKTPVALEALRAIRTTTPTPTTRSSDDDTTKKNNDDDERRYSPTAVSNNFRNSSHNKSRQRRGASSSSEGSSRSSRSRRKSSTDSGMSGLAALI